MRDAPDRKYQRLYGRLLIALQAREKADERVTRAVDKIQMHLEKERPLGGREVFARLLESLEGRGVDVTRFR